MSELINQLKSLLNSFRLIFIVVLIMLGLLLGLHFLKDVPIEVLTNDVAVIGELPVYAGMLSQIGIFLWAATASICLFSSLFIKNKTRKRFIIFSACFTVFLALDDAFMFHEDVFPSLGIHQKVVFLGYGMLMIFYLFRFYKIILTTDFLLFIFALGWFGISMLIDNLIHNVTPYVTKLAEDGAKFIGIVSWLVYFARTCRQYIRFRDLEAT